MARKSTGDKPLVIVESPAKARTIAKFLGTEYVVEASIGHVRDLPKGRKEVPTEYKKEEWAYLGIDVNHDFNPIYIIPDQKKEQVQKLRTLMKDASELYLATDEDREGEAISWHLCEILKPNVPVKRLVFHEITETALHKALREPRDIDQQLVQAQETRRIVDRLFGYDVSPLLWRKFGRPGLSAGRVQSVAVRLIVDRERERIAFRPAEYWDLAAQFAKGSDIFPAKLIAHQGKRLAGSKDFDQKTGKLTNSELRLLDATGAESLAGAVQGKRFTVAKVEEKPFSATPSPPFTTSTLQQESHRKLRFTAKRTMQVAQSLYENGFITYMRTDSTNLAEVALETTRKLVGEQYGAEYLPSAARMYRSKVKNAQEAHEAIRPTGDMPLPADLQGQLNEDQYKLYDLIWKRTIACQMVDSRERRISVALEGEGLQFTAGGKTIDFAGFKRAYVEGSDDPDAELESQETLLPPLKTGESVECRTAEAKGHTTQPPGRFSEATLTRTLEQLGIGRPSTYASIIDTILNRDYVFKKGTALVPTWTALAVINLLETYLPAMVDYAFTARMEDDLDSISRGEAEHISYLHNFYYGSEHPGLKKQVDLQIEEIDPRIAGRIVLGSMANGDEIAVRLGKFGPYVECGERTASLPAELPPDELDAERAQEILDQAQRFEEPLGTDPESGKPIFVKNGRFGPYVQLGEAGGSEKPKYSSLLKGMEMVDVTFEVALALLSLPRLLGKHPERNEDVFAANGRYGAYVKCGSDNRSIPEGGSPIAITLDEAVALLAQPKQFRRGFGAPKEPLKVFPADPAAGRERDIRIMQGKYGPYVSDGETNASLPKDANPDDLTIDEALRLIAARIASGKGGKKKKKKTKKVASKAKAASADELTEAEAPKATKKKKTAAASTGSSDGVKATKKTPSSGKSKTAAKTAKGDSSAVKSSTSAKPKTVKAATTSAATRKSKVK